MTDQDGAELRLGDYRGAPVIMEFIYTTCPDICLALGTAFEQLDDLLPDDIRLISVSFDPSDDMERLAWFAERYGAQSPRSRVAGVVGDDMRAELLKRAGVVVIPDGFGGFVHDAGLYFVTGEGKLSAVLAFRRRGHRRGEAQISNSVKVAVSLGLSGVALILALAPPSSQWLLSRLTTHILGQYILLIAAGVWIGLAIGERVQARWSAIPLFVTAAGVLAFWLLPRWIDASLNSTTVALFKTVSLVCLVGAAAGIAWRQASQVVKGFVISNGVSMLIIMSWLQQAIPSRLCNAYLISDQRELGTGMAVLAGLVVVAAVGHAILNKSPS